VLPAAPLVFYAYGFVWVVLLGYLWAIWRQVGRVEQDLEAVRRRVGDGRGGQ
jgi:CcmD family protein